MWVIGLGLLLCGLFLLFIGGFLFITIIFIPLAIIAAIIGFILLIAGVLAAVFRPSHIRYRTHYSAYNGPSGQIKYCTRCGAPNALESIYCGNCGKKF
jgi:MFS superfamily sulfate permease-like transporter